MPKSDDPIEQTRDHYVEKPSNAVSDNVLGLAKKYAAPHIPIIGTVYEYFKSKAQHEKQQEFNDLVLDLLDDQGKTVEEVVQRIEAGGSIEAVALATERILWGASKKKVRRFAAVVSQELTSSPSYTNVEEAISFIRAIDELSEDDIRALKHLYNYQGKLVGEIDSANYNSFFQNNSMREMLDEAVSLGMSMGEFYAYCSRLSGYGLALRLDRTHGSVGNPDNIPFRLTLMGKRLVDILVNVGGETTTVKLSDLKR